MADPQPLVPAPCCYLLAAASGPKGFSKESRVWSFSTTGGGHCSVLVAGGKTLIRSVLGMPLVFKPCVPAPGPPKTWTTRQPMVSVRQMIFSPVSLSTYPTPRARSGWPSDSMAASRT